MTFLDSGAESRCRPRELSLRWYRMVRYDIYIFEREGGPIIGYHPFEVADDAAALEFAAALSEHRPMELWREDILVQTWPKEASFGRT